MRRLARWTLNALTALSLMLCVGTCVIWVRSYWVEDYFPIDSPLRYRQVVFARGGMLLELGAHTEPPGVVAVGRHWTRSPPTFNANQFRYERTYIGFGNSSWTDIDMPLWAACLGFAVLPVGWLVRRRQQRRRCQAVLTLQRAGVFLCPGCGYDLRATPHRCPECGRAAAADATAARAV